MKAAEGTRSRIRPRYVLAGLALGGLVLSRLDAMLGVLRRVGVLR